MIPDNVRSIRNWREPNSLMGSWILVPNDLRSHEQGEAKSKSKMIVAPYRDRAYFTTQLK